MQYTMVRHTNAERRPELEWLAARHGGSETSPDRAGASAANYINVHCRAGPFGNPAVRRQGVSPNPYLDDLPSWLGDQAANVVRGMPERVG
jgi:hypothetical protein